MSTTPLPSEHQEQVLFVQWFRRHNPGVLIFAIPNGGARSKATAGRLKAEGVVSGMPDLYIPAWRAWIEMKRQKGGKVSPEQRERIEYLMSIGDAVYVCAGFEAAKNTVLRIQSAMFSPSSA